MKNLAAPLVLASCIALMTIPAFTQTEEDSASSASATIANVYVQTSAGVNVYGVSSAGKPTLVKGSPFDTSGQMEGVNGKYLISVGTTNLHTYSLSSSGVVGKQVADVNTQSYDGKECGATSFNGDANGSQLDHSGEYFYVQLFGAQYQEGNTTCASWQSYKVESTGELKFLSSMEYESFADGSAGESTIPTISSNDAFGFGVFDWEEYCCTQFSGFSKSKPGALEENNAMKVTGPTGDPSGPYYYFPLYESADPSGHLAVLMYSEDDLPFGNYGPTQLVSYTINSKTGSISSTNTWKDMPEPEITNFTGMDMSISGKLLALSGNPGLEIFHYNGAAPITKYSGVLLPTVEVDQLGWDNNNHLYALSYSSDKLYVYTVTTTSIKEVAGSPFTIQNAYGIKGMIVVPK